MRVPRLIILGYSEASMLMRSDAGMSIGAIISIHGSREFGVESIITKRLDLTFDDVDIPDSNDIDSLHRAMARKNWTQLNGLNESPPTIDQIESIIHFAQSNSDLEGTLLCHCFAGMSRAPAAALICLAAWSKQGNERQYLDYVRQLRPGAVPHQGMLRFADTVLGTKLLEAVKKS